MLLANKHFTIVIGIDIHFTLTPPFNPIHPYIGLVVDVGDYIPFIGATTYINHVPRGVSDTSGKIITFCHIPLIGSFALPMIIGHESSNFFASINTSADGRKLSPTTHMLMTCNDIGIPLSLRPGKKFIPIPSLFAPTSFSIPIPMGMPVFVGGPYVPDWGAIFMNMVMGYGLGCLMKGAGSLFKKGLKAFNKNVLKKSNSKWAKNLSDKFCKHGFEPVNLVTGAVLYEGTDFELPGPIPLAWKRRWMSDSQWEGLLGHGCHSNFDMRVEPYPDNQAIAVTLSDGRPASFIELLPGESDFNREEQLTLYHRGEYYELFDHTDRMSYHFPIVRNEKEYRLTEIQNEAGHRIECIYRHGFLHEIIDSAGRRLLISNDNKNRIKKVELYINFTERETLAEYAYNENGDMNAITDAMGKTTRMVYENHLMVSKTDRNGQTFYWRYEGTTPGSRCIHTWGDGGILEGRIEYHKGYNLVTDSLGNTTRYDFLPDGRVTSVTDPLGAVTLTEYTPEGEVFREIDPDGNITGYSYNEAGQHTGIIFPDGSRSYNTYYPDGKLQSETTPEGASTIYAYNENGLLDRSISPDNLVTHYIYNEQRLVSEIHVSDGREIKLHYDRQHNLTEAHLPGGMRSEWKYDHRGQVIESNTPAGLKSSFAYDSLGRIIRTTSPDGNTVRLAYNAYEEVVRAEDSERKVEFTYTPLGSMKTRKENGQKLSFSYNTEEQLTGLRNEAGERYLFRRDKAGRITRETGFDGLTRRYQRDANGLVRRVERPGERWSEYVYDSMGRLCGVEYHDGTFEQYAYNRDGLLTEARNINSQVKIVRDKQGRIVEEWQDGHKVESLYDETGRRTKVTSSLGADLDMGYTGAGFLHHMRTEGWDMQLKHDERGLEIERVLTGGVVSRNEYDSAGRVSLHTVAAGNSEMRRMRYQWGTNDRLIAISNELTRKNTWFDYDTMGNLTGATYNNTEKLFRLPDAVGNLYKTKEQKDRKYGAGGRLLETEDTKYHYDDEGNLKTKVKGDGERWQYEWNANGSLKEVVRPDRKKVSFEYDALGRRTAKIFDKKITRWVWDGNTPLHEWDYKFEERPQTIKDEFGFESKDKAEPVENLITWVFEEGTFKPAAKLTSDNKYSIITDYLGTPAQMYDGYGNKTWEAELDIYGKVHNFAGSSLSDCPFRYQGQYFDEETGLAYNRFRYYDPQTGGYISQDPVGLAGGNPTIYGYVRDVNSWVDVLGLAPWGKEGFNNWFDNASVKDIVDNKSAVEAALRSPGGKHEMFPVSMAPKAKELGFTANELKSMTVDTKKITFVNVPDGKGNLISGPHHTSSASSTFHNNLMDDLGSAKTKSEAKNIISKHHNKHMKVSCN